MSKRLVGLETEYSIVFWDKEAGKLLPGSEFQKMIEEALGELGLGGNYLENGARLYIDQGTHPEYATPECSSAEDVVKCDKAGERIMETVCRHLNDKHRAKGVFYMHKDNSDRKGNSFGCHENYLIRVGENKFAAWQYKIAPILLTFLTTRQILCGAGKIGKEEPTLSGRNFLPLCMPQENDAVGQEEEFHPNLENDPYQISQRADFLDIVWGESNRERKCFIADKSGTNNHCDIASYRRLHVTCGDANMSEYSAYLKIGTALAVLDLLEDEKFLANLDKAPIVRNPLTAVKAISRDPGLKVKVALACGGEMTAIEIQRWFLKEALKYQARNRVKGTTAGDPKLLKEWSDTLDKLEKNPGLLVKKIDWLIKKNLIERYMESRGLDWSDPAVLSIDVAYHDIEHSRSVYRLLEQNDETQRLFDESDIRDAIDDPPPNSRATVRALFIKISEALEVDRIHVRWDGLGEVIETVKLKDPDTMPYEEIAKLMKILLRFTEEYKRKQKEENFREPSPIPNT